LPSLITYQDHFEFSVLHYVVALEQSYFEVPSKNISQLLLIDDNSCSGLFVLRNIAEKPENL